MGRAIFLTLSLSHGAVEINLLLVCLSWSETCSRQSLQTGIIFLNSVPQRCSIGNVCCRSSSRVGLRKA